MVKIDVARQVAQEIGVTEKEAIRLVELTLTTCKKAIAYGELKIPNFGTFERVKRQAKKGRDLKKNTLVDIPARYTVSFKASNTLKKAVL